MLKKRGVRGLAVGAAAVLAVLGLDSVRAFDRLEWKSWDARMALFADPSKASKDIVLIQVDQYSLDFFAKQGITWPWPRGLYGAIVRHLAAGGAKAVFFDIAMTETSWFGEADDDDFSAACAEAGNVVLPVFLSPNEPAPESVSDPAILDIFRKKAEAGLPGILRSGSPAGGPKARAEISRSVTLPIPPLLRAARATANVGIQPDADTIYRRTPVRFLFRGGPGEGLSETSFFVGSVPLALVMAGRSGKEAPADSINGDGRMIIRYFRTDPKTGSAYESYTAASVINSFALVQEGKKPDLEAAVFAGKIVLVGLTAVGLFDIKASPLSGSVPGVEIQAAAVDTMLNNRAFDFLPGVLDWLYIAILALAAGWTVSILRKPGAQAGAFAGFLLAPAAASTAAFGGKIWLDFVAPFSAILLTIVGAAVLNYMVEGRERRFLKGA
ncbi:MAG: CHASE2 domain-containing protein, partial [Candidatus Aminicenantes bacterium]|nr:CHASE2 domain-containing protein [Candidatus Aminicenantes bacterium]